MSNSLLKISLVLLLAIIITPGWVWAATVTSQGLFHIARSKNANIIQYDAQVGTDGKLVKSEPVVGYWIRLAEQGQVKKLSWLQRTFAFGFRTKIGAGRESAKLTMKVDLGEPISIIREEDQYRATAPINGSPSYLEKIFIQASGKGMFVKIEYIELFGKDMETGESQQQQITP